MKGPHESCTPTERQTLSNQQSFFFRTENNVFYVNSVETPEPSMDKEVTHHVFVVDRSGSMWGDIDGLKSSIEQVLAAESLLNGEVETSLISFSSHRDVTLHWSHVSADKVVELNGPYIKELRGIRATYLTGISQGLELALDQVKPGQTTGITLFTDGYANDPSSSSETKAIREFVEKVKENHPNVFVNTIGYRDWCDWTLMEHVANSLSGKCLKAKNFKDVLAAMKDTQALLSGSVRPAVKINGEPGHMFMAVNRTTGQVNATKNGEGMSLRGVGSEEKLQVFKVVKGEKTYNIPKGIHVLQPEGIWFAGALSKAFLGLGEIRTAKEILFSSGNKSLWEEHQSAMTPSSLATLGSDLTEWVKLEGSAVYEMGRNVRPPHNIYDLVNAINSLPPKSIGLDEEEFNKSYRRRSIKKIPGTRNPDGSITAPKAELVSREGSRVYVKDIEFNTSDASVQVNSEQAVWVKRLSDGKIFEEVGYVSLEGLRKYRSFTLISSGERNVEVLPLEVYNKVAWEKLSPFLAPHEAREFEAGRKARILLKKFRVEKEDCPSVEEILNSVQAKMESVAEVKILSAMQDKEAASPYTASQIEELKELHLSPALYFSAPTTVHYTDKDEAVRLGQIDSFTRYNINFGTVGVLSTDEFRSGNAFVQRRYAVTDVSGAKLEKPTLPGYQKGDKYTVKPPGKAKDSQADTIMARVADAILISGEKISNVEITGRLKKAELAVKAANQNLQGLVMEIGCTGLLPPELESKAQCFEPEAFAAKYGVKLGKDQKEGVFYVIPGAGEELVISVVPETSWYTVKVV